MTSDFTTFADVSLIPKTVDTKLVCSKRKPGVVYACATTYRPIAATCRKDECAYHPDHDNNVGRKCYVARGHMAHINRRLEDQAAVADLTALQVTEMEARLVTRFAKEQPLRTFLDLRLGVTGEVSCTRGVQALAKASSLWRKRVGGRVWSYTHTWRRIARAAFGEISILASVDDPRDVPLARSRGYVPAIVVHQHTTTAPFRHDEDASGTRFVRCPNETMGMACVECRLCLNEDRLFERGMGIAFAHKKRKLTVFQPMAGLVRQPSFAL